jgi:prepilin-type N-terminal cleavage/methylation domain-containing protein
MSKYIEKRDEQGFTLIELLIAIVVVGVLTAVAIVGIAGLTDEGEGAACSATADAVKAAQAVHYANSGAYPTTFTAMTGTTPPELEASGDVTVNALTIVGKGWTLTGVSGGGTAPMTVSGCP